MFNKIVDWQQCCCAVCLPLLLEVGLADIAVSNLSALLSQNPFVSTTTAMQDICARAAAKEGAQFLAKIILARATRSLVVCQINTALPTCWNHWFLIYLDHLPQKPMKMYCSISAYPRMQQLG